jgi:hypothetical protein
MDSNVDIYVLTELTLGRNNEVSQKVANVTTDITEAEAWAAQGVRYGVEGPFTLPKQLLLLGAETTQVLTEIRSFKNAIVQFIGEPQ